LEPHELSALVHDVRTAWLALGNIREEPRNSEATQRPLRRSLYIAQDMKAGDALTPETVRSVRPGNGMAPIYYERVLGRRVKWNVAKGAPLSWELLENISGQER
jgi:N-acetylneuraminate synthase